MAAASRSVVLTLFLLSIIIFVFAVGFRQATDGTPLGNSAFRTVPIAFETLLLKGILPDQRDVVLELGEAEFVYKIIALIFILVASLTVLNMLVGVLCEV